MASPTRFTSGITQDAKWQPLGEVGIPDPFFYAYYEDDFLPYNAAIYTVTASGGTIANTSANGSGGRVLFTTGATAGNFAELQLPLATIQYTVGKKLTYLTRINAAQLTSPIIVGLINTTATPFTGGSITDGIYFSTVAASNGVFTLNVVTGSVVVGTLSIPNVALVAGKDLDIGFLVDRLGNIKVYMGNNLLGFRRANTSVLGPDFGLNAGALTGSITSALLNPTIAISNGTTAAAATLVSDLQFAGQER